MTILSVYCQRNQRFPRDVVPAPVLRSAPTKPWRHTTVLYIVQLITLYAGWLTPPLSSKDDQATCEQNMKHTLSHGRVLEVKDGDSTRVKGPREGSRQWSEGVNMTKVIQIPVLSTWLENQTRNVRQCGQGIE